MMWDILIKGATVLDGGGSPPEVYDVAVKDGRIAAKGVDLPAEQAKTDRSGAMPHRLYLSGIDLHLEL